MTNILQYILWALMALPFLLVLLVTVLMLCAEYSLRRTIRSVSITPCPKCGAPIGRAAVLAARRRYSEKIREMMKQHPGVRFRPDPAAQEWGLDCPNCGFRSYYYPNTNKLETASILANKSQPATGSP